MATTHPARHETKSVRKATAAGFAAAVAISALATFGPIYRLRLSHHDPDLTWLVNLHGVLMFAWITFLFTATNIDAASAAPPKPSLLATLALLGPAFGRLTSIVNGFGPDNDLAVFLLMMSVLCAFVVADDRILHRLHPAAAYGAGLVAAANILTYGAKLML